MSENKHKNTMETRKEILFYIDNLSIFFFGLLLFAFPLVFFVQTTDSFVLPRQIIVGTVAAITILLLAMRMVTLSQIRFRRTPLDVPLLAFALFCLLSSIFAANFYDALLAFIPVGFAIICFFTITNHVKTASALFFIASAATLGGVLAASFTIAAFFKKYLLPLQATHVQTFSPFGSLLDQAMYFAALLPIVLYIAWPLIASVASLKRPKNKNAAFQSAAEAKTQPAVSSIHAAFLLASLVLLVGLGITLYALVFLQKPLLLPFSVGFQTAFAAISQDTQNLLKSFLLGSGYGTYMTDFTRFKPAVYNLHSSLWSFTFFRSSSLVLELLATTGILGLVAFLAILIRFVKGSRSYIKENPFFFSVALLFVLAFILPFSFTITTMLFLLLGLFAAAQGILTFDDEKTDYYDSEMQFVTAKKGALVTTHAVGTTNPYQPEENVFTKHHSQKESSLILPLTFTFLIIGLLGYVGYYAWYYVLSDMTFQKSLVAASQNNGQKTYDLQAQAITQFPYRDGFYRTFSQTNLTIANAITSQQPKNASPSAHLQEQVYKLVQQSLTMGRDAVTVSPQTSVNWSNLGTIYQGIIGYGQNAESFAVAAYRQAIALDPANPQLYVSLGGVFYQLKQYDLAQQQFQIAVQLKPDYANAFYNLGHTLEAKGDLKSALVQYQQAKALLEKTSEEASKKTIAEEIKTLEEKIGQKSLAERDPASQDKKTPTSTNQQPLQVSSSSAQLPAQKNPVEIPPLTVTPTVTAEPTPSPKP